MYNRRGQARRGQFNLGGRSAKKVNLETPGWQLAECLFKDFPCVFFLEKPLKSEKGMNPR